MDEKQTRSSEEIDLLYFLRPISNAFKRLNQGLDKYFGILRYNKFIFFGILIVGTVLGFALRYIIPPAYEIEGIYISKSIPGKYCSALINNLNDSKDIGLLSQQLNIPLEAAGTIESMRLIPMGDTFALANRDTVMSLFAIILVVNEIKSLDTIQAGLVNFLENNDYARRRKEARIRSLQSLRASLKEELKSLDSLKVIVSNSLVPRSQGQGIILGEPVDPVSIYEAQVEYQKELLKIEEILSMSENIEILQPLLSRGRHNYPDYNAMLLKAFLLSLLAALTITPLIGRKRRANPAL